MKLTFEIEWDDSNEYCLKRLDAAMLQESLLCYYRIKGLKITSFKKIIMKQIFEIEWTGIGPRDPYNVTELQAAIEGKLVLHNTKIKQMESKPTKLATEITTEILARSAIEVDEYYAIQIAEIIDQAIKGKRS